MKNKFLRLALVVLAVAGMAGAGYFVFTLEQRASALRDDDRAFTEDLLRLQSTLAELRAAQPGYVASGQDTAAWIGKVAQLRQQAEDQLRRIASAPGSRESDLSGISESLAAFGRFDARTQEVLRDEQPLAASSLIFGDASQVLGTASNSLSLLRGARATRAGSSLAMIQRQEIYAAAGAAGLILVVLLLLLPRGRATVPQEEAAETEEALDGLHLTAGAAPAAAPERHEPGFDFDLSLPPRRESPVAGLGADWREEGTRRARELEPVAERTTERHHASAHAAASPGPETIGGDLPASVDLAAAARLCTDLARVQDTNELQGLLARAAALLDASGIVVWMGSVEGDVLWPAFSHGYSPQALARMQALPRDGATPVSVAYRKGLMEVVPAAQGSNGAIVAPILTANGCVGAMAVEVSAASERSDAAHALASIVAAQLATLVAGEGQSN